MPDEDNPNIQCECGCGIEFMRYDEMGRSRRFVPGHNMTPSARSKGPPRPDIRTPILSYLQQMGAAHRGDIAAAINKAIPPTATALSRLRKIGLVEQAGDGKWRLFTGEPLSSRENPEVSCACGCGIRFRRFDKHWRERKYISGHNQRSPQ
jgi:hypothetical protein